MKRFKTLRVAMVSGAPQNTAFDSADQRIEKGLQAFDIASKVGWAQVRESIAARVDPARATPRWFPYEIAPTGGTVAVG